MIKFPTLMINFKTYEEASGKDAVDLVKICKKFKNVSCVVSAADLNACAKLKVPILAQNLDIEKAGGNTGKIHVKMLIENGASGVLINHSENRVPFLKIKKLVKICKENKLFSVVCSKTVAESKKIASLKPDCIAIEPPGLIGGDVSVTSVNPSIISNTVSAVKKISSKTKVLCGAGVKNGNDVKKALELGASGVLIASGVTKAKNKKKAIQDLVKGLN